MMYGGAIWINFRNYIALWLSPGSVYTFGWKNSFFSRFIWIVKHVEIHFWWNMLLRCFHSNLNFSWYFILFSHSPHSSTSLPMEKSNFFPSKHFALKNKSLLLFGMEASEVKSRSFFSNFRLDCRLIDGKISRDWNWNAQMKKSWNANQLYRINLYATMTNFFFGKLVQGDC